MNENVPPELADFQRAGNQGVRPDLYEIENRALDPCRLVLNAMREVAPWRGRTLLDLGCGSGFWLPGYAREAARVIGVEPDDTLLDRARGRAGGGEVLAGSAEHLPLANTSVDVVHARFAYFFPPGCHAGLAEVHRVLRPGGALVVVDNDHRQGEFAQLLVRSAWAAPQGSPEVTDAWWAARGASRIEVMSEWLLAELRAGAGRAQAGLDVLGGPADADLPSDAAVGAVASVGVRPGWMQVVAQFNPRTYLVGIRAMSRSTG